MREIGPNGHDRNHPARDAAREYISRGWKPVPVSPKEKRPTIPHWQRKTFEPRDFRRWDNVAIQLGACSGGLLDVDIDCKEARKLAPYFLPRTDAIFGHKSSPRSHHLFVSDLWRRAESAVMKFNDPRPPATNGGGGHGACLLELRCGRVERVNGIDVLKGAVSVFPGSRHPSG
jgi:hypothetical protein